MNQAQELISIATMDLSGVLLTDDTIKQLLLLCELKFQSLHAQTLLAEYLLLQEKKKEQPETRKKTTAKEEIMLGAPLDIKKTTVWSVGYFVEGTAHRGPDVVYELPAGR